MRLSGCSFSGATFAGRFLLPNPYPQTERALRMRLSVSSFSDATSAGRFL